MEPSGERVPEIRRRPRLLALLERLATSRPEIVRALSYGRVGEAEAFARQMEHLARRYAVVSAARVVDASEGGRPLPPRSVLLTFRETRGFAAVAWPILERHGFAAVLFVSPASTAREAAAENRSEGLAPELLALAAKGLTLGVSGVGPAERGARAAGAELARALAALERGQTDAPRVVAYAGPSPGEDEVEAVRRARADLAFTTLPGALDLRWADPVHLRSTAIDAGAPLDSFRAQLVASSPRWRRLGGLVAPAGPEERRFRRAARAQRTRMRCVYRPLDALLAAGARPRPPFLATLRASLRWRASNHERLRNLASLSLRAAPPLERWLQDALLDTTRLPFSIERLELMAHGSAATVFRLELGRGRPPHVLKVYRWTLGQSSAGLLQMGCRQRARYRHLRRWFGETVLRTHFLVLAGPLRAFPVAATLQELLEDSRDLLAPGDEELLRYLRFRPGLAAEFGTFARRVLEVRAQGFFPDLLGPGNLLLAERGARASIRLIDCDGLYDLRCRVPGLPRARLDAAARRLELLALQLEQHLEPQPEPQSPS